MNEKLIDTSSLSDEEIDFYNYTKNNLHVLIFSTLKEVASSYGCGISFIYKYFEKINVSGIKEYIYKLGFLEGQNDSSLVEFYPRPIKKEEILSAKQIESELYGKHLQNLQLNFQVLSEQTKKISKLCEKINKFKNVFGFGLGHAEININDVFGMFVKFGINATQIFQTSEVGKMLEKIDVESGILIVYSFRGRSTFTLEFIRKIKENFKNFEVHLVTANKFTKLAEFVNEIYIINNNTSQNDYIAKSILISPTNSFAVFNDFLKNIYYWENYERLKDNKDLVKELESWRSKIDV